MLCRALITGLEDARMLRAAFGFVGPVPVLLLDLASGHKQSR